MQCNRNVVERNPETKNSPLALIPNTRMGKKKKKKRNYKYIQPGRKQKRGIEIEEKEDKTMMKSSSHSSHHVQTGSHAYTDTPA